MDAPTVQQLVRYATRAANSHNTQPWRFHHDGDTLRITVDTDRRCPVVDPEDRHVVASLGCATENLVVAGASLGVAVAPRFDTDDTSVLATMTPGVPTPSAAFEAIDRRQCTRRPFDPDPLPPSDLDALAAAATEPSVSIHSFDQPSELERLRDLVARGQVAQAADRSFVRELASWIRFNRAEAERTRDGLYTAATGNPRVPSWLGRAVFPLAFRTAASAVDAQMRGTPLAIVITVDPDEPASWFGAGRMGQRLQLVATSRGLASSYMNQAIEVASTREDLTDWLGERPALLLRFGRAPSLPGSYRRPVSDVLD